MKRPLTPRCGCGSWRRRLQILDCRTCICTSNSDSAEMRRGGKSAMNRTVSFFSTLLFRMLVGSPGCPPFYSAPRHIALLRTLEAPRSPFFSFPCPFFSPAFPFFSKKIVVGLFNTGSVCEAFRHRHFSV